MNEIVCEIIQILVEDGLPQSICKCCADKLKVCQDFSHQCHSATKVLNTVLAEHVLHNASEMKQEVRTEAVYLVTMSIEEY